MKEAPPEGARDFPLKRRGDSERLSFLGYCSFLDSPQNKTKSSTLGIWHHRCQILLKDDCRPQVSRT